MVGMSWFATKALAEPATIPHPAIDELEAVEKEYRAAEKAFSKACHDVMRYQQANREASSLMLVGNRAFQRVNGGMLNPRLSELCRAREDARARRNELLNHRASALKRAGRVR